MTTFKSYEKNFFAHNGDYPTVSISKLTSGMLQSEISGINQTSAKDYFSFLGIFPFRKAAFKSGDL